MNSEQIISFEKLAIDSVTPKFKKGRTIHFKWYGLKDDNLLQFGNIQSLFDSNPNQIMFEAYDHNKTPMVVVTFFNADLIEINCLEFSTGWKLGKRVSDINGDSQYEITDPKGVFKIVKLSSNLYSKAFKFNIIKYLKFNSFEDFLNAHGKL
ncbi:MAG: hypothetical protein JNL57_13625 [Bacteroidetes bacterium]|nr:hypothetical protein [Bacteroidota bacterium]